MTRSLAKPLMAALFLVVISVTQAWGAVKAYDPNPADGAGDVSLQPTFSWKYEGDSCNVYGGISPDDLRLVISFTTSTSIRSPQKLPYDTAFYWRVDVNARDQVIEGDLWSFRTEGLLEAAGCNVVRISLFSVSLLMFPLLLLLVPIIRSAKR